MAGALEYGRVQNHRFVSTTDQVLVWPMSAGKLTTRDIQQFYTHLKQNGRLLRKGLYGEGLSNQTVQGIHTALHAALDKAVEEKLIFRNPADNCKLPPAKSREMKVLAPEEIQRLLIQDGCYELLLLELATGLRRARSWRSNGMT